VVLAARVSLALLLLADVSEAEPRNFALSNVVEAPLGNNVLAHLESLLLAVRAGALLVLDVLGVEILLFVDFSKSFVLGG